MSSNIEKIKKILLGIMMLSTTGLLINSCIDPMYDMAQGINTEIQVGGDSLTLPIGTTDSIRLGDFLSSEDLEFLKTMEDGGYGMTISDSLTIDDLLKDMDVDKLKFDDQTFSQITQVDFGDIDVSDFSIPGFTKNQESNMNIPSIEIGDIVPTVDLNTNFDIIFSNEVLNDIETNGVFQIDVGLSDNSDFVIFNDEIPVQINDILSLHLEKQPGTPYNKNLIINITIDPKDLQPLENANYQIDYLEIIFPDNFTFEGDPHLTENVYSVQNIPFNVQDGHLIELNLKEIDLKDTPVSNRTLDWSGDISYTGQISISGSANSQDMGSSGDNPFVNLKFDPYIQLNYATVVTNPIKEQIDDSEVALEYEIDIAEQVKRLGIVNVEDGCKLRIDITQPDLPLPLEGDEIVLQFSDLYIFYADDNLNDNNEYIIKGTIPEYIELELEALRINRDLDAGNLLLKDTFFIIGNILLTEGTVNSTEIASLENERLTFTASVSDMHIEATSIEMNSLVTNYVDSTLLEMQIEDIPSQIIALDSLLLKDGGEMELKITINDMPDMGSSPLNAYMVLKFPELLVFAPGAVNNRNELIINEPFDSNNQLIKKISIEGFKFDGSELNGRLAINDKIHFDVEVSVDDPTVNSDDLQGEDITVDVAVKLKGLEFKSVYGRIDVDFGDQMNIPNIPLDDLPEFMRSKDVVLDILNPILALKTESNVGIPVDTELSLTKYVDGNALTDEKINLNFSLPKVNSPDEIVQTGYWFAPKESGMPNDYTFVETNLQNLFKPIPDSVKVEFTPHINTGVQHMIDLVADYNLKVKYDITIPFSFGKDLSILLRDTIDNVNLDFGDSNLKTGALEIVAKITNSIPLDLELELQLMDDHFNILGTSSPQTILAGAPDGSGVDSNIKIRLDEGLENINDLNKVVLVFKATSNETVAGTPIKPSNFIKASLKARVLGGINITL